MTIVTMDEFESQFSELKASVLKGNEIIITENGIPVLKVSPIVEKKDRLGFGIDKGKFEIPPDFDDPLPEFEEYM